MDKLYELMAGILGVIYPKIVFDAQGLTTLLLPCLLITLAGLAVTLLLKLNADARRFAYAAVVIAMIAMIAASAFFPVTLKHAGDFAAEQIHQRIDVQETEAPDTPG